MNHEGIWLLASNYTTAAPTSASNTSSPWTVIVWNLFAALLSIAVSCVANAALLKRLDDQKEEYELQRLKLSMCAIPPHHHVPSSSSAYHIAQAGTLPPNNNSVMAHAGSGRLGIDSAPLLTESTGGRGNSNHYYGAAASAVTSTASLNPHHSDFHISGTHHYHHHATSTSSSPALVVQSGGPAARLFMERRRIASSVAASRSPTLEPIVIVPQHQHQQQHATTETQQQPQHGGGGGGQSDNDDSGYHTYNGPSAANVGGAAAGDAVVVNRLTPVQHQQQAAFHYQQQQQLPPSQTSLLLGTSEVVGPSPITAISPMVATPSMNTPLSVVRWGDRRVAFYLLAVVLGIARSTYTVSFIVLPDNVNDAEKDGFVQDCATMPVAAMFLTLATTFAWVMYEYLERSRSQDAALAKSDSFAAATGAPASRMYEPPPPQTATSAAAAASLPSSSHPTRARSGSAFSHSDGSHHHTASDFQRLWRKSRTKLSIVAVWGILILALLAEKFLNLSSSPDSKHYGEYMAACLSGLIGLVCGYLGWAIRKHMSHSSTAVLNSGAVAKRVTLVFFFGLLLRFVLILPPVQIPLSEVLGKYGGAWYVLLDMVPVLIVVLQLWNADS